MKRSEMNAWHWMRIATAAILSLLVVGCVSQPQNAADSRQSIRRKPTPNLDRAYGWGSTPGANRMEAHVPD
jgi:hypothetical protein